MNLHISVIALLIFGSLLADHQVHCRVLEDVDNSIETTNEHQQQQQPQPGRSRFEQDWIKFTKAPEQKILQTLGTPVEIVCEVMGSQVPTIQWVVGHLPLSELDSLESNIISESSSTSIVRVRSIHIVDHMLSEPRTYTCIGRTGPKVVYASTTVYPATDLKDLVQVRDKPFLGPHKPRIIYNEKMHLDLEGSNIVLPCKVHARPRAEVFWMNVEGKLIEQNHRFKVLPNGDLLISDIKWEDMGTYKCIARNSVGKDTADTFIYPVLREEQ